MPAADHPIFRLVEIMARLRTPEGGCPWDLEQTFATIAPYTIEEAYEVADAIDRGDLSDLKEELGDLLLQVVFHAQMAEERGIFDFAGVADTICEKLVRRHPHVFGEDRVRSAAEQTRAWEAIKAAERSGKAEAAGALDGLPVALPALTRALKLSQRAARVGFVWPSAAEVLEKLREEVAELEAEVEAGRRDKAAEELGDVLFVCANLARELDVDPETTLKRANDKFIRRFRYIEAALEAAGSSPEASTLAEMDALWDEAKAVERKRHPSIHDEGGPRESLLVCDSTASAFLSDTTLMKG
jgi:MazG family protein